MNATQRLVTGLIAGAAGTVALDVTTYADMALRGRAPSSAPSDLVKHFAQAWDVGALAGDDDATANRRSGTGALLGYVNGLGTGVLYGAARAVLGRRLPVPVAGLVLGALAMAISDVPLIRLGLTDPKAWGTSGWAADVIPHAIYGLTVAATYEAIVASV